MRNFLVNTGILLISVCVCLLAAEFGLRYLAPQDIVGSWRVTAPAGYRLNKSSGTAQHNLCGISAAYEFFYPHLRGTSIKTTGRRILTLGDSFTFGWLLNEEFVYVSILQDLADKEFGPGEFAFLNAGTAGHGTADYVRFVEDFGKIIKPEIVIVFLNTDDIGRSLDAELYELRDNEAKTVEVTQQTTTGERIKSFLKTIPLYHWLADNSHLIQALRRVFLSGSFRTSCADGEELLPKDPIPIPETSDSDVDVRISTLFGQALFRRLRGWCLANDADLLVITTGWFAFGDKDPTEPTNAFIGTAEEFFGAEAIPYFDPTTILKTQRNSAHSFIFAGDSHPNEKGARLIAESVWGWLRSELAKL